MEGRREGPRESVIVEALEGCDDELEAAVLPLLDLRVNTDVRLPLELISVRSMAERGSAYALER